MIVMDLQDQDSSEALLCSLLIVDQYIIVGILDAPPDHNLQQHKNVPSPLNFRMTA